MGRRLVTYLKLGVVDLVDSGPGVFLVQGLSAASGTEWGSPQPIETTLANLRMGPLVVQDGYEARVAFVAVRIRGVDSGALATAEAVLWRELGKPNTLTWQPADGRGPASVFEIMTSNMVGQLNDAREAESVESPSRIYVLRMVCRPFVRSTDKVTIPALVAGAVPSTTVITDGSTDSGWSSSSTSTIVASNGDTVYAAFSGGVAADTHLRLAYDTPVNYSGTPYLTVEVRRFEGASLVDLEWTLAGLPIEPVSFSGVTRAGFEKIRTFTFDVPQTTAGPLEVATTRNLSYGLGVSMLTRSNVPPGLGTARQLVRTIEVPGSAPTEGSLQISHDTSSLGTVLAYTWRDDADTGWAPPLMPWLTSGGASADANRVSGRSVNVTGATVFEIPASMPDGSFVLLALMKSDATQDVVFEYQLRTKIGAHYVGPTISGEVPVSFNSTSWVVKSPTGLLHLPTLPLGPDTNATLEVTIQCVLGIDVVSLDEAWLFNTDVGQLSWLAVGSGAPAAGGNANRVWINSRTLERPRPEYLIGTAEDGSDAYGALANSQLMFPTEHVWDAGTVNVLTVTSNALYAAAAFDCYARAPFHVAP